MRGVVGRRRRDRARRAVMARFASRGSRRSRPRPCPARRIDHGEQKRDRLLARAFRQRRERAGEAARLQMRQFERQRAALGGGEQLALAAVGDARRAARRYSCSSSSFSTRLRLCLVILQDVEQFGDRQAGLAIDEMQDAMMRAAEVDSSPAAGRRRRRNRDRRRRTVRSDRTWGGSAAREPPAHPAFDPEHGSTLRCRRRPCRRLKPLHGCDADICQFY